MRAGIVVVCGVSLLTACGGGGAAGTSARTAARPHVTQAARMRAAVRAWSAHLNAGDDAAEAGLFALPATMVQGPYAYRLATPQQVARWHAALPCSGTIVSISVRGRTATAVFRLGNRKTSRCDAPPGTLAAARFTFRRGKIVLWQQVPPPTQAPPE